MVSNCLFTLHPPPRMKIMVISHVSLITTHFNWMSIVSIYVAFCSLLLIEQEKLTLKGLWVRNVFENMTWTWCLEPNDQFFRFTQLKFDLLTLKINISEWNFVFRTQKEWEQNYPGPHINFEELHQTSYLIWLILAKSCRAS